MIPTAERRMEEEGDERPKKLRQLKKMAMRKKDVAFDARMSSVLHSWVMRSGLKGVLLLLLLGCRARITAALARRRDE